VQDIDFSITSGQILNVQHQCTPPR
jgi:hypothetical protein